MLSPELYTTCCAFDMQGNGIKRTQFGSQHRVNNYAPPKKRTKQPVRRLSELRYTSIYSYSIYTPLLRCELLLNAQREGKHQWSVTRKTRQIKVQQLSIGKAYITHNKHMLR